ncbi:MAG TPA: hypothetical protein VLW52_14160 [Opitutaceae bacterium]|nr:hypothetical protein [Opitutaceae bacterium]
MKPIRLTQAVVFSGLLASTLLTTPPLVAAPCDPDKAPHTITIPLQGRVNFYVFPLRDFNKAIVDPSWMYTLCDAELIIHRDEQNVVLHTKESIDFGPPAGIVLFREIFFKGRMTPSGRLELTWPGKWLELGASGNLEPAAYPNVVVQIETHTGYDIFGPEIDKSTVDLVGTFDGRKLFGGFHIFAFQKKPGIMGPYIPVVDGPIDFSIWLDLQVSE